MNKTAQQSLLDLIIDQMPDSGDMMFIRLAPDAGPSEGETTLYEAWLDSPEASEGKIKRPASLHRQEIDSMVREGLVRELGDCLELTSKGTKILTKLILKDDTNSFGNPVKKSSAKITSPFARFASRITDHPASWFKRCN